MKRTLLLISCLYLIQAASAQECDCAESLHQLFTSVERNYSLFQFKVSGQHANLELYGALKKTLLSQAKEGDCNKLMNVYIHFFNDGHLWVIPAESEATRKFETLPIDSAAAYAKLTAAGLAPIEGIWESTGYKIAILKNETPTEKRDYVGVILSTGSSSWNKGDVKLELTGTTDTQFKTNYYLGDHTLFESSAVIKDDYILDMKELSKWRKTYPLPPGIEVSDLDLSSDDDIKFADLGNGNYYLKIPSFAGQMKQPIEELIANHHQKLVQAKGLIIDVRDNGGGNDNTYYPLLPYIDSGPDILPTVGFWISEENKAYFSNRLTKKDSLTQSPFFKAMQAKGSQLFFAKAESTQEAATIYAMPNRVAVIANQHTGSSAETFVYRCRQSSRVITFGQNTAGIVDGFNGNVIDYACFSLRYPTSVRTPNIATEAIDPIGMYPDVYLSEDMEDPVAFIVELLNSMWEK